METTNIPLSSLERLWNTYYDTREDYYRDRLMSSYIPFLEKICYFIKLTAPFDVDLEDLESWGGIGLLTGVEGYNNKKQEGYDNKRQAKPKTYLYTTIRNSIFTGINKETSIPLYLGLRKSQVTKARRELEGKLKRKPTREEILIELSDDDKYSSNPHDPSRPLKSKGLKKAAIILEDAEKVPKHVYLEDFKHSEPYVFADEKSPNPCDEIGKQDFRKILEEELDEDKRLILELRFQNQTMREIAEIMKITHQAVQQQYQTLVKRLRNKLTAKGFTLEYCLDELAIK
jgi:RNA polymerase sigma factor (sigma-70 family)